VEAVAYHHLPSVNPEKSLNVAGIVHAAFCLENELHEDSTGNPWDETYFREIGLTDRIDFWRQNIERHHQAIQQSDAASATPAN